MPRMLDVYDLETGQQFQRQAVTAYECVVNGRGRYTLEKPEKPVNEPAAAVTTQLGKSPPTPPGEIRPAAAPPQPAPSPEAERSAGDDLTVIVGIGEQIAERLDEIGITTFAELAACNAEELAIRLAYPGKGEGAVVKWIEQAARLAR